MDSFYTCTLKNYWWRTNIDWSISIVVINNVLYFIQINSNCLQCQIYWTSCVCLHLPGQVSSLISFSGDLFNNATDSTMDFVKMSQSTRKTGLFTLLAFKESSRLEFLSCFMGFLTMTRSLVCMLLSTNTILTTR